jgi:hypothetical protein
VFVIVALALLAVQLASVLGARMVRQ